MAQTEPLIIQVPYLKDNNHHDFGHIINKFRFGADLTADQEANVLPKEMATRAKLGIRDPLQSIAAHTEECTFPHDHGLRWLIHSGSGLHVPMWAYNRPDGPQKC